MPTVSDTEMLARYQRAEQVEKPDCVLNATLYPHWVSSGTGFGYWRQLPGGERDYRWVDMKSQQNTSAPERAPQVPDPNSKPSPDGRYTLFAREHNLWLLDSHSGQEEPLTTDGSEHYVYGGTATAYGRQEMVTLEALWSPDSQKILAVIKDNRDVMVGPPLVEHVPRDGSLRPRIIDGDRRVGLPGDEHIEGYHLVAIDVATKTLTPADYPRCPVYAPPYVGYLTGHRGWWGSDNRTAYFTDLVRGGKTGRLMAFDTQTGETQILLEETDDTRFCFMPDPSHLHAVLTPLSNGDEVIWYSLRTGRAHLYLYDLKSGELKQAITEGEWIVRGILHVDEVRRELWIQTAGRYPERNPLYCDICRVNIDTGELTEVISTDDEYVVTEGRNRVSAMDPSARGVSPCGNYVVTTRSRVDTVPQTLLVDREGNHLLTVETADISGLPEGWTWPEPVLLKAADGKTIIDGVVFKPAHFDPANSYPVIDSSFGKFMPPTGSFSNTVTGGAGYLYNRPASLAQLGFITVVIGQRGAGYGGVREVSYTREKEYWNCISPNQADCVEGIKQLAQTRPYMDLTRVGIGGRASTHAPVGGMLRFPDFYKVGVSCNAYLDHRLAGEFYSDRGYLHEGALEQHPFHALAKNLTGKLLLMHGMMNPVTPVAATFGFVEALKQAGKRFDMLLLPNEGHSDAGYMNHRRWDYFVEHLLGETPPEDFVL